MEIKIGIASIAKSGAEFCGDSYSLVERLGGMTLILSDGHGNTAAAQQTSRWVTQRARSLVLEGKDNDAVAKVVHDELYEMKDRKVACALTMFGVDAETVRTNENYRTAFAMWCWQFARGLDENGAISYFFIGDPDLIYDDNMTAVLFRDEIEAERPEYDTRSYVRGDVGEPQTRGKTR